MISDTLSEAAAEMRGDLLKMPDSYPPGEHQLGETGDRQPPA